MPIKTFLAKRRQRIIDGSNHEISDFAAYLDELLAFVGVP